LGGELLRAVRVAVVEQREDAASQGQPRVLRRVRTALEKPVCTLEPCVCARVFTAERYGVPPQPYRHPRRAGPIVLLTVHAVRAFANVEDEIGRIEPPGGKPEALQRFGLFLDL